MKTATDIDCYQKYFNLKNGKVIVTLKNGRTYTGWFVGITRDESDAIVEWHLLETTTPAKNEIDPFFADSAIRIQHKDLLHIYFEQDQSILQFKPPLP